LSFREFVVQRITVITFGVNDRGISGTGSSRIEVRPGAAKLMYVIVTSFGERFSMSHIVSYRIVCYRCACKTVSEPMGLTAFSGPGAAAGPVYVSVCVCVRTITVE